MIVQDRTTLHLGFLTGVHRSLPSEILTYFKCLISQSVSSLISSQLCFVLCLTSAMNFSSLTQCPPGWTGILSTGQCYFAGNRSSTSLCRASEMCQAMHNAQLLTFESYAEWMNFEHVMLQLEYIQDLSSYWFGLVSRKLCNSPYSLTGVCESIDVQSYGWIAQGNASCTEGLLPVNWTQKELEQPWLPVSALHLGRQPSGDGRCHEIEYDHGKSRFLWNDISCTHGRTARYVCKKGRLCFGTC